MSPMLKIYFGSKCYLVMMSHTKVCHSLAPLAFSFNHDGGWNEMHARMKRSERKRWCGKEEKSRKSRPAARPTITIWDV